MARVNSTQLTGLPKVLLVAFSCKLPILAHAADLPKISSRFTKNKTNSIWFQHAPYLLISSPKAGISPF